MEVALELEWSTLLFHSFMWVDVFGAHAELVGADFNGTFSYYIKSFWCMTFLQNEFTQLVRARLQVESEW